VTLKSVQAKAGDGTSLELGGEPVGPAAEPKAFSVTYVLALRKRLATISLQ